MSAPGVQLSSETHISCFQPSVRQYLQQIEQAVISKNVPAAQQILGQLEKTVATSTSASGGQFSGQVVSDLQKIGAALAAGDLDAAGRAVDELRQHTSRPSVSSNDEKSPIGASSGVGSENQALAGNDVAKSDPNFTVRV